MKNADLLRNVYEALLAEFGPQHWWPGETRVEIVVGAILTQNTNWANVEKAIANLKASGALDIDTLRTMDVRRLARLIRPSGYFNIKARRLKAFVEWVGAEFDGDLDAMFLREPGRLREGLLSVKGIGRETADSMLLYAGEIPKFVVDAYTYRVFSRHGLIAEDATYDEIAEFFEANLPQDVALYNEYHALIVALGKNVCKRKPLCEICPVRDVFGNKPFLED